MAEATSASSDAAPPAQNAPDAVKPKSSKKFHMPEKLVGYFQLLVYADPTWLDITLLVVGFVMAVAAGTPFPIMGILFGQLVDDMNSETCSVDSGNSSTYQSDINNKIATLVYIGIGSFAAIYIYIVCWSLLGRRLAQRLRERYFQSLLKQEASFFDNLQAGEVSSRLNNDIQAIQSGTSEKVGIYIACVSFFITAYVVAFIKDAKLAGMLISLVPAFFFMSLVGGAYVQKYSGQMSDYVASASSIALEGLSSITIVQAFSANARLESKFSSTLMKAQKSGMKKAAATAIQAGLLYFIAYSANALAYWQGSRNIADAVQDDEGGASVGRTYTVIFILVDASLVLSQVAPFLQIFGAASSAFRKLRKDIEHESKIDGTSEEGEKLATVEGKIELRNVSFTYPSRPEHPVIKNISLVCPAGKHTAIVGLSGSGKSTIAGLVTRLYDPGEGTILLDDHDVQTLNVRNLRSFTSLVQQEPSLLDRSILENIALGLINSADPSHVSLRPILLGPQLSELAAQVRSGADIDTAAETYGPEIVEIVSKVKDAAKIADASVFINRLEFGFGTLVGSSGSLVSGGQKQRIAVARAIIRDPRILILDEATASLDSISEQRIQTAIEGIASGRTLISIAHRLSTIRNADNIIVMKTGEILEQGTHAELLAMNGAYASMVNLQRLNTYVDSEKTPSRTSTANESIDTIAIEKETITTEGNIAEKSLESVAALEADNKAVKSDDPKEAGLETDLSAWRIVKKLSAMVRPYALSIVIAFSAATIVGGTYSGSALIFGNTVGSLSPCETPSYIRSRGELFALMFFILGVVEFFANFASWSAFGWVSEKLLYKVRVLSFRSLFEQDLQWHQSRNRNPSMLLSFITKDGASLAGLTGSILGTIFSIVVNFIAAIILSHIVAWKIAVVCLATIPILLGSGIMQIHVLTKFERKYEESFSSSVGITVEAVTSIKTVASLSLEHEVLGVYRRSLSGPVKGMVVQSASANIWLAISNSIGNFVYALAYWWGSKQIAEGRYTQTEFFIVVVAMLVSAQLWGQMFSLAPDISRARAAIARILTLIDMGSNKNISNSSDVSLGSSAEKDVEAIGEGKPKSSGNSGVAVNFNNVSFAYPARPQIQILQDMSFTVQPGQFVALVGPSGAGKSTVISLLERMYSPAAGTIEIDGFDISRRGVDFRDELALVPQDNGLFEGTVRFNVALGARPDHEPTDEEIEEACRLANIHDTIMALPQGYDTECGPNGSRLSGGQRQRLAIARALVRKPRLLLLDESTSALDAESEKLLQDGLEKAARGITLIAIAHRLHTIRKADVIFLVENGKVVDKGRHEELMERSESYRVNALHQMLGD